MAKPNVKSNPQVPLILAELERFKEFCVEFGYVYNEADLYNPQTFAYRQFTRYQSGKTPRNMWAEDNQRWEAEQRRQAQF